METIEETIDQYFKSNKLAKAKLLAKEILTHPDFCVSQCGKHLMLKKKPKTRVSLLDFLSTAIRHAGPAEGLKPEYATYTLFTSMLLARGTPQSLFVNKLLLPSTPR